MRHAGELSVNSGSLLLGVLPYLIFIIKHIGNKNYMVTSVILIFINQRIGKLRNVPKVT